MGTTSPQYEIAQRASRFMLSFAKAQSLEAALAQQPTPPNGRSSTLALLWGVTIAHARAGSSRERDALDAIRLMLLDIRGGADALQWLLENRDSEEFQAWAEIGEMAVRQASRVDDPMPALLDTARQVREEAPEDSLEAAPVMPVPGSQLLTRNAQRQPPLI